MANVIYIQGNSLRMILPLRVFTLHEDGTSTESGFVPSLGDTYRVSLNGKRQYHYEPTLEEVNEEMCAIFSLSGSEAYGPYGVEFVVCRADGTKLRYACEDALTLRQYTGEVSGGDGAPLYVGGVKLDAGAFIFAKGDRGEGAVDVDDAITEDTRSQATDVNITGAAPFATLAGGQRIVLHLKYANTASPTLQLTVSGGTTTSAYPLYQNYNNGVNALTLQAMPAGSYGEFVFDSTNSRWVLIGKDFNTTYSNTSQADINSAAQGSRLIEPKLIHDNAYIVSLAYSSGSLKANKMYDFGEVTSALTIPSLDSTNDLVSNALNFYALRFIAGADNLSITFPTGVEVDDTPTINTGDYVEIMINLYVENNTNHFYASIKVWQAPSQNS